MTQAEESPATQLLHLLDGFRVAQAIHVAAVLGLADLLEDGPLSSQDLAAATDTKAQPLYRLLRALAALGVFREEPDHRFVLTPVGGCLRMTGPHALGPVAVQDLQPEMWEAWGHLLQSVRTGQNAFRHAHGRDVWEYRARHPEASAVFDRSMVARSERDSEAVLAAYDFSRFGTVVDVGGGKGAFLAALLVKHRALEATLFDQAHVVAGALAFLQAAGVEARCQIVSGSFFETVPNGGDAYVLKMVIHDWTDNEAVSILQACRSAMSSDARLLLIEHVVGAPNDGLPAEFFDLQMLVGAGGQERTRDEFVELLDAAGFRLVGVTHAGEMSVIEAARR